MVIVNKLKDFQISSLFDCVQSKGDNQAKNLEEGNIPLVSATQSSNGIIKFIKEGDGKSKIFKGKCITVNMFGKCFYQPEDFYAESHGIINILIPKFKEMDENVLFFILTIMEHEFKFKYSYNRMLSQNKLEKTIIKLPIDNNENLNFEYMRSFILNIKQNCLKESNQIINVVHNISKYVSYKKNLTNV